VPALDYRALYEDNPSAIVVFETATRELLAVNDAACTHFGFTREELLGRDVATLRPPEDMGPMLQAYAESVAKLAPGPMPFPGGVWRHQRKDGSIAFVEIWRIRVDFDGRAATLAVISDVSQRVRAEQAMQRADAALRASEERLRALIEHSADGVALLDASGRITFLSSSVERSLGWDSAVTVGTFVLEWVHPDDLGVMTEGLGKALSAPGGSASMTARFRRPDGSWRWIEGTATNLLDLPAVGAVVGNIRDVTDRRHLEEQVRQSQKMEATGLLAGGIAHDFNNLLGVVVGATELARRAARSGLPAEAHLAEIEAAARRAADLTRKRLAFSRKQVLALRPLDLGETVEEFIGLLRRIIGENVELEVLGAGEPLTVSADASQLEQVLLNLATNARQAMPAGGRFTVRLGTARFDEAYAAQHPWARPGDYAELTVMDTGVGMDTRTQARALEPFFTTRSEGTGLGLAVVHGIVHQHRGLLRVESQPGAGTRVSVFLPIAPGARPGPPERPVRDEAPVRGGSETVLLAEDEPALRKMLERTLTGLGYRVILARDGEEAARAFEAAHHEIALAILDVVMPKASGVEAYARMRAIAPSLRVIFTTGHAPESAAVSEILSSGGHALLSKPFSLEHLGRTVRETLDARR
jgi:two-component system cell cycle sensor histidine kinase/response regulator CckA